MHKQEKIRVLYVKNDPMVVDLMPLKSGDANIKTWKAECLRPKT